MQGGDLYLQIPIMLLPHWSHRRSIGGYSPGPAMGGSGDCPLSRKAITVTVCELLLC